jgi:hypothetical protein
MRTPNNITVKYHQISFTSYERLFIIELIYSPTLWDYFDPKKNVSRAQRPIRGGGLYIRVA